ncbi:transposase [Raoultella ornithinolytica]|uniref:transposase n=1 Tax=Raoultella ornithinolytica TaxID=54291 RepID=UPI00398BB63A
MYSIAVSIYLVWIPKYKSKIPKVNLGKELYCCIYIYFNKKKCSIVILNVQIEHIYLVVRVTSSLSFYKLIRLMSG